MSETHLIEILHTRTKQAFPRTIFQPVVPSESPRSCVEYYKITCTVRVKEVMQKGSCWLEPGLTRLEAGHALWLGISWSNPRIENLFLSLLVLERYLLTECFWYHDFLGSLEKCLKNLRWHHQSWAPCGLEWMSELPLLVLSSRYFPTFAHPRGL